MKTTKLILAIQFCVLWGGVFAQVFPGDANNNGLVNNVDILYIGRAYGTVGPSRLEGGTTFEEHSISVPWNNDFPNGLNYAFADANGNGIVEITDFFAVSYNYGAEQGSITPDEFINGNLGTDPGFNFEIDALPGNLTEGSIVAIPIQLGNESLPLTNCNGLAFTIEYDSDILHLADFDLQSSFVTVDQQYFSLVASQDEGELDVAITRFGQDPVGGWGNIGVLSMIIEDNLIDFLPGDIDSIGVVIRIKDIMVLDSSHQVVPTVGDSIEIMVHHPDALVGINDPKPRQNITIYPNPSPDKVTVTSSEPIQRIEVMDVRGANLASFSGNGNHQLELNMTSIPGSLLLLQIYTNNGFIIRKLYKQK